MDCWKFISTFDMSIVLPNGLPMTIPIYNSWNIQEHFFPSVDVRYYQVLNVHFSDINVISGLLAI